MGTIAQEIDRINGGKNSIIESTNVKLEAQGSQLIPANTKIDEISPYIDAIQQGGNVPFLELTDLSYMFDYKSSNDDSIMDGIERLKNNEVTNLNHAFYFFKDDRYLTVPAESHRFLDALKYYLSHFPNVNKEYIAQYLNSGVWNSAYNMELDLSDIQIVGTNIGYGFANIGTSTVNRGQLIIALGQNTLKNIVCSNLFSNCDKNIKIKLTDNRLNITRRCDDLFYYFKGDFVDSNNNILTELNISVKMPSSGASMRYLFYFDTNTVSEDRPIIERLNFLDFENVIDIGSAFGYLYQLKSVTGINLSNLTSTSQIDIFNASSNKYFDKLGEFGIVNGSTLGNQSGLKLQKIWNGTVNEIRDGQTIGYWYEKFANALGNKAATGTQTITISRTLYNSLSQAQIELITDKGYTLASA